MPWSGKSQVVDVGIHSLKFINRAVTTSDVPCPRCTCTIEKLGIKAVVIPGSMSLRSDYYEVADLYHLFQKGVAVVNKEFMTD